MKTKFKKFMKKNKAWGNYKKSIYFSLDDIFERLDAKHYIDSTIEWKQNWLYWARIDKEWREEVADLNRRLSTRWSGEVDR